MAKVTDAVIVCAVVLALDMAAGLLAILAQAAREKVACDVQDVQAYRFGMAASVLFLAADSSTNLSGRLDYICPQLKDIRESISKRMYLTVKWVSTSVFLVGGMLLIAGAKLCGFLLDHALGIRAILCFVHSGIIIGFYMSFIAGCRRDEVPEERT